MKNISAVLLFCLAWLSGEAGQPSAYPDLIELSSNQAEAFIVAASALRTLDHLNDEQRKIKNYKTWIYSSKTGDIVVSFIAIPRPSDNGAIGGNYDYARSTKFIVDPVRLVIKETVESK